MKYRELEAALLQLHKIKPANVRAFRSRLRLLRDIGVPNVVKPGKGSQVEYGFEDLWQAHMGLSLGIFGFPPLRVKYVTDKRDDWVEYVRDLEVEVLADIWIGITRQQVFTESLDKLINRLRESQKLPASAGVIGLLNASKMTRECENSFDMIRSRRNAGEQTK
jgi:hypothetical protein